MPSALTADQLMSPCQCDTSMPGSRAGSAATAAGSPITASASIASKLHRTACRKSPSPFITARQVSHGRHQDVTRLGIESAQAPAPGDPVFLFNRDKTSMPTPDSALPGRSTEMRVPDRHYVNGAPLKPPYPDEIGRASCRA